MYSELNLKMHAILKMHIVHDALGFNVLEQGSAGPARNAEQMLLNWDLRMHVSSESYEDMLDDIIPGIHAGTSN